jgi:hypothetical protein
VPNYEGRLRSSWTHLITLSRNFVEVRWRSFFSKYLPWQAMHFLTTLHPLLQNVLQTVNRFEISSIGAPFSWLEKPRSGLCGGYSDRVLPIHSFQAEHGIQFRSRPVRFRDWKYSSMHFFTLALDGGAWSASRPSRFTPRERASNTNWIGGWVSPRAVLDAVVKRKIPSPHRESNTRTPISSNP